MGVFFYIFFVFHEIVLTENITKYEKIRMDANTMKKIRMGKNITEKIRPQSFHDSFNLYDGKFLENTTILKV